MDNSSVREKLTRSVDALERIYAVVVALAVTLAIQNFFIDGNGKVIPFASSDGLTVFGLFKDYSAGLIAFIATMVPFYHGMHRHLNKTYIEREVAETKQGFLLLDFFVFFVESCLLVAFAVSLTSGVQAFIPLILLLIVDAIWAIVAHGIHYETWKNSPWKWSAINIVVAVLLWFTMYANWFPDETMRMWALAVIAVLRTVFDYVFTWQFYFPSD